ncbi:hypothetical protein [Photobacterium proteolyticum]|nr:hypothetical protein [Photobacterium proteolyticum]
MNSFKNYDELVQSGIIDKGWLPPYLPRSATNIEEEHYVDTNIVYATFDFHPDDILNDSDCKIKETLEFVTTYSCEYRGSNLKITMFNTGHADLFSQPK